MSRSRQVKNADQILRRLVSTLEYPYAMQQTLSAGDYEGVLNIYRRVQSLPASSGLRILKRVSSRADSIVADMKQKIVSTLLSPTPVFSILPRLVKLIQELEDEDGCRHILQQCFDKQMTTFEENVRSITMKFSESLLRAYMKGQEINMMNKDADRDEERAAGVAVAVVSSGSRHSMTQMGESGRRIVSPSTRQQRRSQIMEVLSVYDSDSASVASDHSDEYGMKSVGDNRSILLDPYDDGEMDYGPRRDSDALSESGSVHSSDTSHSAGDPAVRRGTQMEEDWLSDPDVDYSEILCAKVRAKTCQSVIEVLDMWLPSVNRVLQILSSAYPSSAGGLKNTTISSALTAAIASTPRKGISGNQSGPSSISRALNTTYGRNQSIAGPAKQLGECLISCADIMRTIILGFRCKTTSPIITDIGNKAIFSQDMMQDALKEPFLTSTVMEVSEVYDGVEAMLTRRTRQRNESACSADDFDNINFFGSSVYRDAIVSLRAVAEDGEGAVVKNAMDTMIRSCLEHLTTVLQYAVVPKSGDVTAKGGSTDKKRSGEVKSYSADDMIIFFENTVLKCLNRSANVVRRPEWVAHTVWESIQRLLDRYIASLALHASENSSSSSSTIGASTLRQRVGGSSLSKPSSVRFALSMDDDVSV